MANGKKRERYRKIRRVWRGGDAGAGGRVWCAGGTPAKPCMVRGARARETRVACRRRTCQTWHGARGDAGAGDGFGVPEAHLPNLAWCVGRRWRGETRWCAGGAPAKPCMVRGEGRWRGEGDGISPQHNELFRCCLGRHSGSRVRWPGRGWRRGWRVACGGCGSGRRGGRR